MRRKWRKMRKLTRKWRGRGMKGREFGNNKENERTMSSKRRLIVKRRKTKLVTKARRMGEERREKILPESVI
jgi:hypothetical protein